MAEHWRLKPETLGSIPGSTTFLSFPLPFQSSSDNNGPDHLYRSSDLGEPHLSGSLCCDEAQILSKSQTHSNYYLSTTLPVLIKDKCYYCYTTTAYICLFANSSNYGRKNYQSLAFEFGGCTHFLPKRTSIGNPKVSLCYRNKHVPSMNVSDVILSALTS